MKITGAQIAELAERHADDICSEYGEVAAVSFSPNSLHEFARALIAMAQEVPDLEWDESTIYPQAFVDNYENEEEELSYLVFASSQSGKWNLDVPSRKVIGPFATKEEAKTAANEHNRKRVLSLLKHGGE